MAVREGWAGRFFENFEVGDIYEHPLGRTVTTTDNGNAQPAHAQCTPW